MDRYVHLTPGAATVGFEEFLDLLIKGKIPVANIADEKEVKDIRFLYHNYIHDLFNHVFLWTAFPDHIRHLVSMRAQKLVSLFRSVQEFYPKDSHVQDYLMLLKFIAVVKFDTSMGSLNNRVFNDTRPFEVSDIQHAISLLERTINFGITNTTHNTHFANTVFDQEDFAFYWFYSLLGHVSRQLNEAKKQGLETFDVFRDIRKEPIVFASLQRLSLLSHSDVQEARTRIEAKVKELTKGKYRLGGMTDRVMTIESFCLDIKRAIQEPLEVFERIKGQFGSLGQPRP
jgi:hypothetical protein